MATPPQVDPVTPEHVPPVSRRRATGLVVGILLFTIAANFALLIVLRLRPANGALWLLRAKWDLVDRDAEVDTLVIGDSTCNQGVRPDVLHEELGGTSLNLCTARSLLLVNDEWILEAYLRKHTKLRRVIVVHTYDIWNHESGNPFFLLLGSFPLPWGFWRDYRVKLDLDLGEQALVAAGKWFPLYSDERSFRELLAHPGKTLSNHFVLSPDGFWEQRHASAANVLKDAESHFERLGQPWHPNPRNGEALRTLVELATEHGLDVVIASAPIYDGVWADKRMPVRFAEIDRWLRAQVAGIKGVHVLDGQPLTFPADEMDNVDHVVYDSAAVYTRWLATKIKAL